MNNLKEYEKIAEKLKILAHPQRICIIKGLMDKSCNVTKMQECMNIPQSTVSQHLSKLKSVGIVEGKRSGLEITYSIVDNDIIKILNILFNK